MTLRIWSFRIVELLSKHLQNTYYTQQCMDWLQPTHLVKLGNWTNTKQITWTYIWTAVQKCKSSSWHTYAQTMPHQCKKKSWVWIQFDKCSHVPTKRNAQGYNCKPLLMGLWSSSNNVRKQLAIQLLFWPGAHFLLQHIWWKSVRFPGLTRTRFCSQLLRSPRDWREPALVMWAGAVHYGHSHAPAFFDKFIHQYSITCWEN